LILVTVFSTKLFELSGHYLTKTPKGNYICLTSKNSKNSKNSKIQIGIYNPSTQKFYPAIENKSPDVSKQLSNTTFIFDQKIWKYQLVE
jgi:hypothetical protein